MWVWGTGGNASSGIANKLAARLSPSPRAGRAARASASRNASARMAQGAAERARERNWESKERVEPVHSWSGAEQNANGHSRAAAVPGHPALLIQPSDRSPRTSTKDPSASNSCTDANGPLRSPRPLSRALAGDSPSQSTRHTMRALLLLFLVALAAPGVLGARCLRERRRRRAPPRVAAAEHLPPSALPQPPLTRWRSPCMARRAGCTHNCASELPLCRRGRRSCRFHPMPHTCPPRRPLAVAVPRLPQLHGHYGRPDVRPGLQRLCGVSVRQPGRSLTAGQKPTCTHTCLHCACGGRTMPPAAHSQLPRSARAARPCC